MCKGQFGEYVYWFKPELSSKYFDVYFKRELHYFLNSGKTWQEKVKHVRGTLKKRKADALVVTALDEIAC